MRLLLLLERREALELEFYNELASVFFTNFGYFVYLGVACGRRFIFIETINVLSLIPVLLLQLEFQVLTL